ncbi:MAG TPA: VTT domain-containing protein [Verrucomicrobiae bacterium]|jgi:membrane protein DedA with SNARE-associated domain|nr:VTT domain-containing protein [Verrucomicrobiae bacterium]
MTTVLSWPMADIAGWAPAWQATGFFLATFILEDVATVGAGLLLAAGAVTWPTAFLPCCIGIWLGDAGLYGLARYGGRPWLERSPLRRFRDRVARSERWFFERGAPILVFSRFVPGARLPTYLAAGFLRLPLRRFLAITGAASLVWTLGLLYLTGRFGLPVAAYLKPYRYGGVILLATGLLVLLLVRTAQEILWRWERFTRWEFWPAWLFYPPVALYCLWLSVKHRGAAVPTAANPGMFSGGVVGESKLETLRDLYATSPDATAEACDARSFSAHELVERFGLPFILKPDVGQRGVGVKLIQAPEQAEAYLRGTPAPLVAQRYAPGPHEVGVFYYRFPHETRGHIFAVTEKIFPTLTGNGQAAIAELIQRDPRARFMKAKYFERFSERFAEVLPAGETLKLVEAGNHAQGCVFRDGMHLCTPALAERIDVISQKLRGFYVGRYDIRYGCDADLRAGRNLSIIELNGAAAEATSIYDARNSLLAAYGTLFRQWSLVFAIGAANRKRGVPPTKLAIVWRKWRDYARLAATYPTAD